MLNITNLSTNSRDGFTRREIALSRVLPDLTPSNVFDDYRRITNTFGFVIGFDTTRAGVPDDLPKLRTAIDSFLTTPMMNRIVSGEL